MLTEPMFKSGDYINNQIKVIELLGSGGQGEVYKVEFYNQVLALKWYYPHIGTQALKQSLQNLISKGAPDETFLWPLHLITADDEFGYLMELRPLEYKSLQDWVTLQIDLDLVNLTIAGYKLADAFHKLHAKGFSYKDISFGNIFINPNNGHILICDNDNITANNVSVSGLIGTPKFMAPEIVMGSSIPNTETDQFSLAVVLFYMFLLSHPLEGRLELKQTCFDEEAAKTLYGTNAVFIFDETNDENRPIEGVHSNALKLWPIYPDYFKSMFHKTFTVGIKDPLLRTRESEWRHTLFKMYNSLFKCDRCGMDHFYDLAVLKEKGKLEPCHYCQNEMSLPPRMLVNQQILVLDEFKRLFMSHLHLDQPSNQEVVAIVEKNENQYYLRNQSNETFKYITEHQCMDVYPQESIQLENKSTIQIGEIVGKINL